MAGIIKGGYYGNYVVQGGVTLPTEKKAPPKSELSDIEELFHGGGEPVPEITHEESAPEPQKPEEPPLPSRDEVLAEYEQMKREYISEGERYISESKAQTRALIEKTKEEAKKLLSQAQEKAAGIEAEASEKGYSEGYEKGSTEGEQKGYDEGYKKALLKCKDTLLELKDMLEQAAVDREKLFSDSEGEIFDAVFEIANKITLDSLKQKDKAVISKIIKEAGKRFRSSERIKVTLSGLDITGDIQTQLDAFRNLFDEKQHVEFEVIKDAPSGTIIVDNDSEITDASISTQLRMIEELGRGKYRDKAPTPHKKTVIPEQADAEAADAAEEKPKRTRKPRVTQAATEKLVGETEKPVRKRKAVKNPALSEAPDVPNAPDSAETAEDD